MEEKQNEAVNKAIQELFDEMTKLREASKKLKKKAEELQREVDCLRK